MIATSTNNKLKEPAVKRVQQSRQALFFFVHHDLNVWTSKLTQK